MAELESKGRKVYVSKTSQCNQKISTIHDSQLKNDNSLQLTELIEKPDFDDIEKFYLKNTLKLRNRHILIFETELTSKKLKVNISESSQFYPKISNIQTTYDSLLKDYKSLQAMELIDKSPKKLYKINVFLQFYDKHMENLILNKIKAKTNFDENEKISLNCLCVAISTINIIMKYISQSTISHVISYVSRYEPYSTLSPIARRIVEMSLYCLCNYYHSIGKKSKNNKKTLEKLPPSADYFETLQRCFLNSESEKIKISSAIVLSYIHSGISDDKIKSNLLKYLREISSNINQSNKSEYLGIIEPLINCSISNLEN